MQMTEERMNKLRSAPVAGQMWAETLRVGDIFLGVVPASKEAYPDDELCQRLFANAALEWLPMIWISKDGNIIRQITERRVRNFSFGY